MSHRLRRKTPALLPIVAWGPWLEIGTKERTGSSIPATMLTGGEGKEGKEQEEVELYPLVGSDGVGGGWRGAGGGSNE